MDPKLSKFKSKKLCFSYLEESCLMMSFISRKVLATDNKFSLRFFEIFGYNVLVCSLADLILLFTVR